MADEQASEDHFAKPKSPSFRKKPIIDLSDKSDDNQEYSNQPKNEQQSTQEAIKKFPTVLTQLKPSKNIFYLEEIKDGTVVKRQYLNNNIVVLGRATDCDLMFEHCSISRYHAALYWKENKTKLDDNGYFYLNDLNSSHGTFHNKVRLEQGKFLKLTPNKSFIKLGASSRLLLFSCVDSEEDSDEEKQPTNTNEQENPTNKYLNDLRIKNQNTIKERFEEENCCSWGMIADEDLKSSAAQFVSGLQIVLNIINQNTVIDKTDNQNSYIQNAQKVIQNWFEYEGYEFEYLISNDNNKFKCTINFPIEDQEIPISGEEEIKKKDAINSACLRACKVLDKACLLFNWQKNSRFEKRKQDSDEEQDDLLDETGERESKRMRLEAMRNKKVDNLDTLTKRLDELKTEIEQIKVELDEIDRNINASKSGNKQTADELDQYMQTVSNNSNLSLNDLKIKKSKGKMKITQLQREKERTERLIKIAQPSQISFVTKSQSSTSSKASELIEKAKAKLNQKKQEEMTIVLDADEEINKNVKVIEVNLNEIHEASEQPFKTSLTFSKPTAKVLSKSNLDLDDDEREMKKKPILVLLDDEEEISQIDEEEMSQTDKKEEISQIDVKKKELSNIGEDEMKKDNLIDKRDKEMKNSTNKQNKSPKKQIVIDRRDEEEEKDDDKFVEWVPPEELETIDKRSHLNEKYGY